MKFIKNIISHPLMKNSVVVFAGSMGANIAGWLYHLIVGRILGTESYGELAALLSLFYIFNVPSNVLQTVLVKFFSIMKAKEERGQAKLLIRVGTMRILLFEAIGLVIILVIASNIASFLHIESSLNIIWLYLVLATYMISIINGSAIQGFQLFTAFSVLNTAGMFIRLIFGILFAFFGVGWTLIGNVLSNILNYGLTFIPLRKLARLSEKPLTINRKSALGFSVPAFMTTLGVTLLFSQDVLLVKHFFTSHDAGIYASLSILGKVIFFATGTISFVLFPVLSEARASGTSHTHYVRFGLFVIGSMCLALTVLYYLFPNYVILAFGPAFSQATPYLGSFALFISFFSLASVMMNILLAIDKMAVWIFTLTASLTQLILINIFHGAIITIININIAISVALFFSLLLYYAYGKASKQSLVSHRTGI